MKIFTSFLAVILLAVGAGWYPFVCYYQDVVYEADRTKYDTEKAQWDSIQTAKAIAIEDSVFNYWISHNDTTLKTIKKISKHPTYSETGYYKKTGKWQCEPETHYSKKLVCEPMKEWVTTDYYVSGYYLDTTWTTGYNNRAEWLNKAHSIAHNEAMRQKVEFHPYDGHEYHFIATSGSGMGKHDDVFFIGVICTGLFGLAEFFAVLYFITTLVSTIRGRIAIHSTLYKYGKQCLIAILISAVLCGLFYLFSAK